MATIDLTKKRIIDFDPQKCGLKKNSVILFSPLDFIEGDCLYLPECVRMSDGSINEDVIFDYGSFSRSLDLWNGDAVSLYAGKNYIQTILNWLNELNMDEKQKIRYFHLPKVINIYLYDNDIEVGLNNGSVISCSSKNGILYFGSDLFFVPDRNPYAESLPLTPVHGMYEDTYSSIDGIDLEGCGRDMFGGIYTLDGKSFIRWDGHDFVSSYQIRDGVEEIREKAFRLGHGSGLSIKNIYLPDTLKRIGREAFMSCRIISNITLPETVVEIKERAFHNCQSLESIYLSNNLRILDKEAFSSTGLKSILIPKSVVHIGDRCFDNCWQLSSIEVEYGNNYYTSEDGILYNIDKTCLIRIPPLLAPDTPDNVNQRKDIESWHIEEFRSEEDGVVQYENFYEGVTYVTRTDSKTGEKYKEIIRRDDFFVFPSINLFKFQLGKGDKVYVDDGEHVKAGTLLVSYSECESRTDWEAYYGPSRREYTIPENVVTISAGALQRCPFKKLNIPKSVKFIGNDQFQYCNFSEIIVSPENEYYESRDNSLIEKKSRKLLHWYGEEKDIIIPQGVDIIGERKFDYIHFKSLVIPEGVKCVEDSVFSCSEQGFSIYLPSSLCYVAPHAFMGLNGMRDYYEYEYNIYVPHGLKQKYLKLLDCYERDIKEIDSDTIEVNSSNDSYKDIAIATEEDLAQAVTDEYGAKYSKDGKRLLIFEGSFEGFSIVRVKDGTEVICDQADLNAGEVHLPASVKYLGIDSAFPDNLIIEGVDTYIAGSNFCEYNTIFIPCGTWAKYYAEIESNVVNSLDAQCEIEEYGGYEEFKEHKDKYALVELSKSSVALYLQQQRNILISLISSKKELTEHTLITSLDGNSQKDFLCFRTANIAYILYIESRSFICHFADTLYILGYTLQDVCDILQIKIREMEVNEDNKESLIGRTLARRVLKSWMEDFVDEDSGEVVSIKRNEVIFEQGHDITDEDVQILLDGGFNNVVVHDDNYWAFGPVPCLIASFSTSEEELSINRERVLGLLFPGKEYDNITIDEKKEMAYNLLIAYKDAERSGYAEDVLVPLKVKPEEQHSEVTAEENRLINLISEFYDQKINAIMDCKTDLDVMPLFSSDYVICNQLESFLKGKGISERLINSFVNQFFSTLELLGI